MSPPRPKVSFFNLNTSTMQQLTNEQHKNVNKNSPTSRLNKDQKYMLEIISWYFVNTFE